MSVSTIDLNVDAGESYGAWTMGDDAALFAEVSSANLACGFHAGDPGTIRRSLEAALAAGVAVGAHPGLADLAGFGRRALALSPQEVRDDTLYQIGALAAFVHAAGASLHHVKPHGALNTAVAETWTPMPRRSSTPSPCSIARCPSSPSPAPGCTTRASGRAPGRGRGLP